MFNLTAQQLEKNKAVHTANEIYQQPAVWKEVVTNFYQQKDVCQEFIESIYAKHENVRVIFTGAGTSAFAGDTLVPELRRQNQENVQFESIPTTDIVSNPTQYLFKNSPTVLVSFARSGNSPESVAAVELGEEIIDDFYQVVVTCNKDGQLAKNTMDDQNSITLLTPEKAHDQGFAMTSSFTSMILTAYALFTANAITGSESTQLIANAEHLVDSVGAVVDEVLNIDIERIVYLGSGLLAQLSHEAALKMLELSAGKVVAVHESSLGFRHGPKSILNENSVVVLFISKDPHTRKYDMDILRELASDDSGIKIVALTEKSDEEVENLADWSLPVNQSKESLSSDFSLALLYVIFAQTLALKKSIQLGITPDNPSPDGRVNRVVKGVTIYDYVK
ncbi:tagatose-6-phosphate ketose isomerase [Virgibacillus profundi]|uniref:Tagatose-6-phosphate ketose isomerase n=1 Tax=Virgibacillus profundi TaxID=2024555 RepID=A0A2A2IJ03_9BACI|nr:SIS domain-containing protein [Virgibacillus profundi]PAV31140.1 tagatose-6-phosphate ketose isomerase [Virgibacillus profundi]PXY55323.1 SIS domain-containing protein [Virgibacillus profundi]